MNESRVERAEPPLPDALYRVVNPLVAAALRSPLHWLLSDRIALLSFAGRRSGRTYTIPVGYTERDYGDRLVLFTHSDWWKNFRGGAAVRLYLRGRERRGRAEPVTDTEALLAHVDAFIDRNGLTAARRLGLRIEGEERPPDAELAAALEGTVGVVVDLDPPGRAG